MRRFDDTMVQPCAKSSVATSSCKSNAHLKRNSLAYLTRKSGVTVGGNWTPGFAARLHHYDYGRSPKGDYALPKTLEILDRQGLKEVFFIEPPVAARFGIEHLAFIINLTQSGGHDIQRHLHLEWTDEIRPLPVPGATSKRQHLSYSTFEEQAALIKLGRGLLAQAGWNSVKAYRVGMLCMQPRRLSRPTAP